MRVHVGNGQYTSIHRIIDKALSRGCAVSMRRPQNEAAFVSFLIAQQGGEFRLALATELRSVAVEWLLPVSVTA